jgi:hypothetical protein
LRVVATSTADTRLRSHLRPALRNSAYLLYLEPGRTLIITNTFSEFHGLIDQHKEDSRDAALACNGAVSLGDRRHHGGGLPGSR